MATTDDREREHRSRRVLLLEPGLATGSSCGRCGQRAASWRAREVDGVERPLCVYCASLIAPAESNEN